ncbi:hypothetical protein [Clostridium psychrophilum]|uniref:hypothetical protein n=1 Tax=Clostridium psychrophilum TaxID=132926 RepID=UPI001C0B5BF6|nr:hypothetical protein [Clostridium psychrophilum]MBU3181836.1 hypothetical protein [Clostridium psychrophilum]
MYYHGLFKKRISLRKGKRLLTKYCRVNGFDDDATHWKETTHSRNWFAYHGRSNRRISNNWVSYHPIRGNDKYTVWIDLVSEEITEILREPA